MKIDCLVLGAFETNCYILRSDDTAKQVLLIDTGLDADKLIDFLKENNLDPVAVVLTHGHADHTTGLENLRCNYPNIKVYIHEFDADMLTGAESNLSEMTGINFKTASADVILKEADVIEEAEIKLNVLHTPGHTPGGISLYCENEKLIFVGDTLFAGSIGRTDFPRGSTTKLITSIKDKLCILPEETIVYPGHGPKTTIGEEKTYNQFLR